MPQPSNYALNFAGPFLGLNTEQAPHMLAPGYATEAKNVLVTRAGGIRPRDPWANVFGSDEAPLGGQIVGMVHVDESTLVGLPQSTDGSGRYLVIAKTRRYQGLAGENKLWRIWDSDRFEIDWMKAASDVTSEKPPTWVFANGWLYIIDGSEPLYKYNGVESRTVGIEPPVVNTASPPLGQIVFTIPEHAGLDLAFGTYQYAVTFADSTTGVESNPVISPQVVIDENFTGAVTYNGRESLLPGRGIDKVNVYRKTVRRIDSNGDVVTTPFFRLIFVFEADQGQSTFTDLTQLDDDFDPPIEDIALSDPATGPFAPSRNGRPPASPLAAYYKTRMWYVDPEDGSILRYSEANQPDHVGSTSFQVIGGDPDDRVAGLVEMAGQLVIVKEGSIWILSGNLVTDTNDSVAKGDQVFDQAPEILKTKSKTGGHTTTGGNGAIVCGHPPMMYYARADGLYRFDGVDDRPVSDLIDKEWQTMMNESLTATHRSSLSQLNISYANDVINQILYVCLCGTGQFKPKRLLCYHYGLNRGDGVGGWTTFYLDDSVPNLGCVATALGKPAPGETFKITIQSPLLVGEQLLDTDLLPVSHIRFGDAEKTAAATMTPEWLWRMGDLPIGGGKRTHAYYLEYRYERFRGAPGGGPTVKIQHSLDGGPLELLGAAQGQVTDDDFLTRLVLGRTARSLGFEFSRGGDTLWDAWEGITGFAVDVEPAEQR